MTRGVKQGQRRGRYGAQGAQHAEAPSPESARWTDADNAELERYVRESTLTSLAERRQLGTQAVYLQRMMRQLDAKADRTGEESTALVKAASLYLKVEEKLGLDRKAADMPPPL